MNFACERCGEVHTTNADRCRSCGYSVFTPVSDQRLRDLSTGVEKPSSIDPDELRTVGTTPDVAYDGSPDVATDGSVKSEENHKQEGAGILTRIRSFLGI